MQDTLAAFFGGGELHLLPLGETEWTATGYHRGAEHLIVTQAGTFLSAARAGPVKLERSTNRGRTWTRDVADGRHTSCLYQAPSSGDVLACAFDSERGWVVLRSADDGATWSILNQLPAGADGDAFGSEGTAFAEIAAPDGRPRLVAAAKNGIAVSDDGGGSWRRSELWGAFRWYLKRFAQAEAGSPAARGTASDAQALGDTLFATGRDFSTGHPVVLASADGEAWELRHEFDNFAFSDLAVGPGGALWVGIVAFATEQFPTVVWRSEDGGRTWAPAQDGYDGGGGKSLAAGSDGRLYLAGSSGVWRTNRIFATDEAAAPRRDGVGLRVYPNPVGGRATVALSLPAPDAIRLAVYDAQGREVLAVHDGAAQDGQRFAVETASLAPGRYVVRVAGATGAATAALTVVR